MIALLTHWKALGLAGLGLVLAAALTLWRLEAGRAGRLEQQVLAAQTAGKADQAKAMASQAAETVVDQGASRDIRALNLHMENSHAIETAPGYGQGLDPQLNAAGRRGLCGFQAYAEDPACIQLRGVDSGQRPQAGGADAAAAP